MRCRKLGKLRVFLGQLDSIGNATAHLGCKGKIGQNITTLLVQSTLHIIILLGYVFHHGLDGSIGSQLSVTLIFGTHTQLMLLYQCFDGSHIMWQYPCLSCIWKCHSNHEYQY